MADIIKCYTNVLFPFVIFYILEESMYVCPSIALVLEQELIRRWDSERELFLQNRTCRGQRLRPLNEFVISTKHLRYLPTHQTDF